MAVQSDHVVRNHGVCFNSWPRLLLCLGPVLEIIMTCYLMMIRTTELTIFKGVFKGLEILLCPV
ncbi:hypothetical protein PTKIN_Ptkin13bG0090000 [Pterospermum kingtungense]